jgi:hypothetical protein
MFSHSEDKQMFHLSVSKIENCRVKNPTKEV